MKNRLALILGAVMSATASLALAQAPTPATSLPGAPTQAPGSTLEKVGQPPAGKAQIVFYRPPNIANFLYSDKLSEDGKPIGSLANGRYLVVTVEPGAHTYECVLVFKGELRLEIDPDETYYVKVGIETNLITNKPDLITSNKQEFDIFAVKGKPQ